MLPPEEILEPPQRADRPLGRHPAELVDEFQGVSQLLDRDAHQMQAIERVERAGRFDGSLQSLDARLQPLAQRGRTCRRGLVPDHRLQRREVGGQRLSLYVLELTGHLLAARPSVVVDLHPCRRDHLFQLRVRPFDLAEDPDRDVEFPDAPQRARHAPNALLGRTRAIVGALDPFEAEHRQNGAKATGRDP